MIKGIIRFALAAALASTMTGASSGALWAAVCPTGNTQVYGASVLSGQGASQQVTSATGSCDPQPSDPALPVKVPVDPFEYRQRIACERVNFDDRVQGTTGCYGATAACAFRTPPSTTQLMYVERRLRGTSQEWAIFDTTCNPQSRPGLAPPPVPTQAQIQSAFVNLPFGKPVVKIQPEGSRTLVNLPTHYRVEWPATGLKPGDVSKPVQLLSWSVRFKIDTQSYTYHYGDKLSSDPTTDPGGKYPVGKVIHVYQQTGVVPVSVDAKLTGQVSVNGGPWEDLNSVADLQDEPVTQVTVLQARSRLVN